MKVYVLVVGMEYEGDEVLSVHKTRDGAEKAKGEFVIKLDKPSFGHYEIVEEHTLAE